MDFSEWDESSLIPYFPHVSEASAKLYARHVSWFLRWLRSKKQSPLNATSKLVAAYLDNMRKSRGWSVSTVNLCQCAIVRFYDALIESELCVENPARGVLFDRRRSRQRSAKRLPVTLFEAEEQKLLEKTRVFPRPDDMHFTTLRAYQMVRLLYFTGLRVSEAIHVTLDDLSLEAQRPVVRVIGKGDREREVPLGDLIQQELLAYLEGRSEFLARQQRCDPDRVNWLFCDALGMPFTVSGVYYIVSHLFAELGFAKNRMGPHVLRHTFATRQFRNGCPAAVVKSWLGHQSLATTLAFYEHVAEGKGTLNPV